MFQSDSDSKDSDEGIRFKTESIRNKKEKSSKSSYRDRSRSRSPLSRSSRRSRRERRSPSREKYRRKNDSRTPSKHKDEKSKGEVAPHRTKEKAKTAGSTVLVTKPTQEENRKIEKIEMPAVVGPALPPHLATKSTQEESKKVEKEEALSVVGPTLPPHLEESPVVGPALPPHLTKPEESLVLDLSSPPKDEETSSSSRIGPQLPPHLRQKLQEASITNPEPYTNEESDDDVYGPVPEGELKYSKSQIALEERALELKMDQLQPKGDKLQPREEWMLELPEVKASKFGLGPRQFRSKPGPDLSDRSSWTDTPETKGKAKVEKVDLKKEAEIKEIRRRDEQQEKISKKHKVKNKDSLLEIHQNKIKKNKKEEKGASERRPFNRETDLQVNRFDEAQKKAVLKKAQLLDDRFSSGQSKFL